jgi:hypothetical protein
MIFFNKIDLAFEITRLHRLSSGSQGLSVVLVVYQQSNSSSRNRQNIASPHIIHHEKR